MRFVLPIALLAVAAATLLSTPPETPIIGLDHRRFASAAVGAAILIWLILSGFRSARPSDIARMATAAMTWAALLVALTGVYAYRFEASEIAAWCGLLIGHSAA